MINMTNKEFIKMLNFYKTAYSKIYGYIIITDHYLDDNGVVIIVCKTNDDKRVLFRENELDEYSL